MKTRVRVRHIEEKKSQDRTFNVGEGVNSWRKRWRNRDPLWDRETTQSPSFYGVRLTISSEPRVKHTKKKEVLVSGPDTSTFFIFSSYKKLRKVLMLVITFSHSFSFLIYLLFSPGVCKFSSLVYLFILRINEGYYITCIISVQRQTLSRWTSRDTTHH